jgi:hypothetical protein
LSASGDNVAITDTVITISSTAAANSRIVVFVSWFSSVARTVSTVSIGGTAAAQDKHATNGSDFYDIWSAHIPGGLGVRVDDRGDVQRVGGGRDARRRRLAHRGRLERRAGHDGRRQRVGG